MNSSMSRLLYGLTALVFVATVGAVGQSVVPENAVLEKLAGGFAFTEGPASDSQGNVYFTDQPNNRILIWHTNDKLSTFMEPCGRANGLYFDREGFLWACADEKNELWRIDQDKEVRRIARDYEGKLLNGPNDVWVAPNGGAYFTDPFYKRDYWTRGPMEQPCQGVYYVTPDQSKVLRVAGDLESPNGLVGTPDGARLYVADIRAGKTYEYDIEPTGALANKRLFCELGSDGMTIDNRGNVFLTGKGVAVFAPDGRQIAHIDVDAPWTSNVCFGGPDRKYLYITASTSLFRIETQTGGFRPE